MACTGAHCTEPQRRLCMQWRWGRRSIGLLGHQPSGVNMATASKELTARLSKRLANFKLSDTVIKGIADRVLIDGLSIVRFDPCIYGICIDYYSDKFPKLDALSSKHGI